MLNKLYSLQGYLNRLSLTKEAIFLDTLIKQAYQEGSFFIEYDDGDPSTVEATLKVIINGRKEDLAFAFASKLGQEVEAHKELLDGLGFEPTGWWHIHTPGFMSYEALNRYGGLGYGQQLYLVLLKYISEKNGVIISAPMTDHRGYGSTVTSDALKVREILKNMSGVNSIDVALTSSESVIHIEKLDSISENDRKRLSPNSDRIGENYWTKAEEEALRSDKDNSKKLWINLSQGTIFWASGRLPISVEVESAAVPGFHKLWEYDRQWKLKQIEQNSSEDLDPPIVPPEDPTTYP